MKMLMKLKSVNNVGVHIDKSIEVKKPVAGCRFLRLPCLPFLVCEAAGAELAVSGTDCFYTDFDFVVCEREVSEGTRFVSVSDISGIFSMRVFIRTSLTGRFLRCRHSNCSITCCFIHLLMVFMATLNNLSSI